MRRSRAPRARRTKNARTRKGARREHARGRAGEARLARRRARPTRSEKRSKPSHRAGSGARSARPTARRPTTSITSMAAGEGQGGELLLEAGKGLADHVARERLSTWRSSLPSPPSVRAGGASGPRYSSARRRIFPRLRPIRSSRSRGRRMRCVPGRAERASAGAAPGGASCARRRRRSRRRRAPRAGRESGTARRREGRVTASRSCGRSTASHTSRRSRAACREDREHALDVHRHRLQAHAVGEPEQRHLLRARHDGQRSRYMCMRSKTEETTCTNMAARSAPGILGVVDLRPQERLAHPEAVGERGGRHPDVDPEAGHVRLPDRLLQVVRGQAAGEAEVAADGLADLPAVEGRGSADRRWSS